MPAFVGNSRPRCEILWRCLPVQWNSEFCGSVEDLVMSGDALFLLMINLFPIQQRKWISSREEITLAALSWKMSYGPVDFNMHQSDPSNYGIDRDAPRIVSENRGTEQQYEESVEIKVWRSRCNKEWWVAVFYGSWCWFVRECVPEATERKKARPQCSGNPIIRLAS